VEPFALTLENGASSGPNPIEHTGHEFVLCLRGQLEYQIEDEVYLLEAGDSLLFSSHLKHRWRNPGPLVTNAIFVLSGFEEGELPSGHHMAGQNEETG
jgi:quercetin dioxygenase-like cupin family protein